MRNSNGKILTPVYVCKLFELSIKTVLIVMSSETENYQHVTKLGSARFFECRAQVHIYYQNDSKKAALHITEF